MMRSGFLLIVSMLVLSTSLSFAYKFNVGGNHGWAVKSSPNHYNMWASRTRFRINDTLFFKYNKGLDSVLVVNKQDYDSCDTKNPIYKMDDGESTFSLNTTGPFYFISGVNCQNGEKFKVVVISDGPSLSPTVSPVYSPTPSPSWNSPAHSPAQSPAWNAPSPSFAGWTAPAQSPSQSPTWNAPSPSEAAPARSPANSPTANAPSPSEVAPVHTPTISPTVNAPSPSETAPVHSPTNSPAVNAPSPSATEKTDSPPPATDKNDSPPSAQTPPPPSGTNNDSPAPPPDQSDSTSLSGYVNVGVVVALVLGSFAV